MKFIAAALILALASSQAFAEPASCPKAAEQLPELLASAKQQIRWEGEVKAEFAVDAQGRVEPLKVEGKRQYRSRVRSALYALDCEAGTPQRYLVSIRFADPAQRHAAPALAIAAIPKPD